MLVEFTFLLFRGDSFLSNCTKNKLFSALLEHKYMKIQTSYIRAIRIRLQPLHQLMDNVSDGSK